MGRTREEGGGGGGGGGSGGNLSLLHHHFPPRGEGVIGEKLELNRPLPSSELLPLQRSLTPYPDTFSPPPLARLSLPPSLISFSAPNSSVPPLVLPP